MKNLFLILFLMFGFATLASAQESTTRPAPTLYNRTGEAVPPKPTIMAPKDVRPVDATMIKDGPVNDTRIRIKEGEVRTADLKRPLGVTKDEIKEKTEALKKQREQEREMKLGEVKSRVEMLRKAAKEDKNKEEAKKKEDRLAGRERALKAIANTLERLNGLKDKITAHAANLRLNGVDTGEAETLLKTAGEKLALTDSKMAEAGIILSASLEQLSQEDKTKLQDLTKEILTLRREAHKALIDATKALKDAVKAKREADKVTAGASGDGEDEGTEN